MLNAMNVGGYTQRQVNLTQIRPLSKGQRGRTDRAFRRARHTLPACPAGTPLRSSLMQRCRPNWAKAT